jgi:hypothetical protein
VKDDRYEVRMNERVTFRFILTADRTKVASMSQVSTELC